MFILRKKGLNTKIALISLAVLLLFTCNVSTAPCPQLCQQCNANTCNNCFFDWVANADRRYVQTCGCPQGYYMNTTTSICNFCPVKCVTCTRYNLCIKCLPGYKNAQGFCRSNFTNSTIQIAYDLNDSALSQFTSYGFSYSNAAATLTERLYFSNCGSLMSHQAMFGRYAFDYDTLIFRTYYGLPFHQWAMIKFQFFIIDQWLGEQLIVQIEQGRNHIPTSFNTALFYMEYQYDSSIRRKDFCGRPQYNDNLGIFNQSFMHTDSMLKFRIRTSLYGIPEPLLDNNYNNINFGIRQVLLIVGICPTNCLTCSSRNLCASCAQLYTLNQNFQCICDTNIAYLTSTGGCIKQCISSVEIFQDNKCKPCGQIISGCSSCTNNVSNGEIMCTTCLPGKFIYQGLCQNICPSFYYEQFTNSSCNPCPLGCIQCQKNQYLTNFTNGTTSQIICSSCSAGYSWYEGACFLNCPIGTYLSQEQKLCLPCPQGCSNCTSRTNCLSCINTTIVNYFYLNGICVIVCPNRNNYYPEVGCINVTCDLKCLSCFGSSENQCYKCKNPYLNQQYSCVSQCSIGYYLQSPLSTTCLPCPYHCETCTASSCLSCSLGYWKLNNQCVRICPPSYFSSTLNGTYQCQKCDQINCNLCIQLPQSQIILANSSSICKQCKNGYYLDPIKNICVLNTPQCPTYFYYNQIDQTCILCPSYCEKCLMSLCLLCSPGKILNNGVCVDECPPQKIMDIQTIITVNGTNIVYNKCIWTNPLCEQYINGTCVQCIYLDPPLILINSTANNSTNYCSFSCPIGYSRSSILSLTCSVSCPSNCLNCDTLGRCRKCNVGYSIYLNSCMSTCPQYYMSDSVQCIRCDLNCIKCQLDGKCIQCETGFNISANGNCISPICINSQTNSSHTCTVCASSCATCTNISNACTQCVNSAFYLFHNICMADCPIGTFPDRISKQCRPCQRTCLNCSSFQTCNQCAAQFYLLQTNSTTSCLVECPPGTYISNVKQPIKCLPCAFPCRSCFGSNSYQCLECISGYYLDYTTCMSPCPINKYPDEYGHCDLCHFSCKQCYGPADFQCINCFSQDQDEYEGYGFKYRGKCYSNNCPTSTYYDQILKQCKQCQQNCDSCSSRTSCNQCKENTVLYNNTCINTCPINTFYNFTNKNCKTCSSSFSNNCQQCTNSGCVVCVAPYYRFNKTCTLSCPIGTYAVDHYLKQCLPCPNNCYNCSSPRSCFSCKNSFKLYKGFCTNKCIDRYFYNPINRTCQSCTISNCIKCKYLFNSRNIVCLQCSTGYVLISGSSGVKQCAPITPNGCPAGYYKSPLSQECAQCHIACATCTNSATNCTQCKTMYRLVNSFCIVNPTPPSCIANCAICSSSSICTLCSSPYYLVPSLGTCVISCPISYYPAIRECAQCADDCLTCLNNAYECSICTAGLYLLGKTCVIECPDSYFGSSKIVANISIDICQLCSLPGCQICANITSCYMCQPGYSLLDTTGNCYLKPKCPLTYYYEYNIDSCLNCSQNCVQCLNPFVCITCSLGYVNLNGTCINYGCPLNTFQQTGQNIISISYVDAGKTLTASRCIPCAPPCNQCLNLQTCINCLPGYSLSNSSCIIDCGLQFYSDNSSVCQPCSQLCLSCRGNSTTCTSCRPNFYLSNKVCVANCPVGMYNSIVDNLCRACGSFCLQCTSSIDCLICADGMWLLNGACTTICPVGYAGTLMQVVTNLYNKMTGICNQCGYPCSSCVTTTNQYQCLSCMNGFYLYQSRCLVMCPTGFFANPSTSQCTPCPSWCLACTSYQSCQNCVNPQCSQNCATAIPSTCKTCQTSCKYCDQSSSVSISGVMYGICLQCILPYHISNGRCVLNCPTGLYLNTISNQCFCPPPCIYCATNGSCLLCMNTTYLYLGTCYTSCPIGTTPSIVLISNITQNICNFNPCIISTYTSSSTSNCSSCLNPYLLYSSQCVINCPNSTYQSLSSRSCQKCPSQCLVCQSYNNCSACTTGYYLQPGSIYQTMICTSQCPAGSYIFNNIMTGSKMCIACLATIPGCQLCEDIDTCKVCGAGWNLYYNSTNNATICVQICPAQFYSYQSICKPCLDKSCLNCSYSQLLGYQCSKCDLNTYYIPSIAKCSSICQQGYYPVSLTSIQTCQQCPLQCTQCVSAANCTLCTAGFALSLNNQCVSTCPDGSYKYYNITLGKDICVLCSLNVSGCSYCIQGTNLGMNPYCLTCQQGWYLLDGICYRTQCPLGYFISQTSCLQCNPLCLECSTATNCTRCYVGYVLSIATNSTYTCTSICTQVNKFFQPSTQTCQSCSTQCYQCFGPRFDQCISCISPLFLLNTTCTSNCLSGYTAINGICIQCDSTCQQCTGVLSTQCSSCATGKYLHTTNVNGITLKTCEKTCPPSTFGNPTTGECVQCFISIPLCSQCFYNSTSKTPQCNFCSGGSISVIVNNILQCQPSNFTCPPSQMYINSINQCVQCPTSCNKCMVDPNTTQLYCYQCTAGYIWYNGQCRIQCPSGTTKTTINSTYNSLIINNQQICIICQQINCFECTAINNITLCTICVNPYVLYNGICLSNCSSSSLAITYNSNTLLWQCTNYTSPQTCQALGLYNYFNLGQSTCIDICPIGYYGNITTATCYLCPSGCQACTSSTSCLTCLPGFYKFNNNQCVSICPTGYLGLNEICYSCVSPCATCRVGLTQCSSCIAGYVLFNTQCFQSCPLGYFLPINSTICSSCSPQCLTCTSLSQCTSCLNSQYSLPNCTNSNTTQCLTNQYLLSNLACANCFNTCATCYGPENYQCITCVGVLIYMNGQCIQTCLSGFYGYTNQLTNQIQCRSCSLLIPNCLNCLYANSNSSCSQCKSPYLLSPDGTRCISTCAQLNTNTVVYSISAADPNRCGACTSNCLVCQLQNCNQCATNFALYNRQCVNICPVSTYEIVISGTGKQCASCGMNCLACTGFQSCKYCDGTNVIFSGICMSTCPSNYAPIPITTTINSTNYTDDTCTLCSILIPRCINCSSTASGIQCSACQTIYKLVNGTCNQCLNQYYYDSSSSNCLPCNSLCLTCINSLQCTSCISSMLYVVSTGQCVSTCPTGMTSIYSSNISQCINCLGTNCAQCSTANISMCTVCQTGYYLFGGSCYQTCPSGTVAYQQICQICSTLNCQICPTLLSCNACLYGYYLTIDSQCVQNCPFGTTSSISASNVSICEPCKTGCLNCSNATNTCNECITGLIPAADGSCQHNTTRYCPIGKYLIQTNPLFCGICDVSCNDCYGSSKSQCFSCNIPTYLMQNGQCISVCTQSQFYNSVLNICQYCNNPCQTCINSSSTCTSCQNGYNLVNNICTTSCPAGTYQLNGICTTCPTYCQTCINQNYCTICKATATILYNNFCNTVCPTGTYQVTTSSSSLNSCNSCPSPCSSCTNLANCNSCSSNYYLYFNQCVQNCPATFFNNVVTHVCDACQANCKYCTSSTSCTQCLTGWILLQGSCTNNCPSMMYQNVINGINQCKNCSAFCLSCTGANSCTQCDNNYKLIQDYTIPSLYCIQQCPDGYNNITNSNGQQICVSPNCQNCEQCPSGNCTQCQPGWYLQNNSCTQDCSISFFGSNQTWQCTTCMDNCLICPNATYCSQCVMGYNFSISFDNQCVTQAVFTYGTIANISGFTSNITQITSLVYLSTSAGPVFFGQMSSTYFNIQFCQFMFFHDGVAGNNSQMKTFLQSLNVMSMSSISGGSSNTSSTRRMLLETQSLSFLQINVPIFAMMGCFIALYLVTYLIHKFIDKMCLSCPNLNFYVKQICVFLLNRFKWIYFDFVVWLSYLPFLYFSLKQVQKFNFNSALQGFSSILSVIILIAYPLYPVLIAYNIKKNYTALCMQNDKMVQMSLSPWMYKVKRPQFIPAEGQPFVYCSKSNLILLYYPLKYFRKFVFVLIVVICPNPIISLSILLGLNIIFMGYMGAFRPRTMPYMIFDFIIEGVMLAFQIFMVAYVIMDAAKISAMSITTHAFGFITANLSIIVAIVLNIVAYYKIFMCIYELYQHLKQKVQQKQKLQAKQKDPALSQDDEIKQNNINDFIRHTDFVLDDEKQLNKKYRHDDSLTEEQIKLQNLQKKQRDIANLLSDKDLIMNNIQPRYDGDIGGNDQFRGLFQDKELYGDQQEINKDKFKVYEDDELPAMKNKQNKKDKITKQNKQNKNKKNNMIQGQLNQTSQYMLKRKQEQYIDDQKQYYNNNSGQRISEYLPNKSKSINQQRNNNALIREKSKTIGLFTGIKNNINNTGDQEDVKLVLGKKNKNKINPVIEQNQSRLSSAKSDQLLFTESPDKLSNTYKQFKNIQVKEGKNEEHSNKKYKNSKPAQEQFDDFMQGTINYNNKNRNKNSNQKDKYYKKQQQINQSLYNQRNKDKKLNKLKESLKQDQFFDGNLMAKDKNREDLKLSKQKEKKSYDLKQLTSQNKKNKISNTYEQTINQVKTKERQVIQKNALDQKNLREGQYVQKKKDRNLKNFFIEDDQKAEQLNYNQRNKNKNGKSDLPFEDGLLISRKPAQQRRRQAQQKLKQLQQGTYRQGAKKEQRTQQLKLKKNIQKEIQEGQFTQPIRKRQTQQYKLQNRQEIQQANNYNYINKGKRNQKKDANQQRDSQINEGILSNRVKKSIQKNQNNNSQSQNNRKQIEQLAVKQRFRKRQIVDQNKKQEKNSFFSNIFGFNRNQNDSNAQRKDPNSSRPQRKNNEQQFQDNTFSSRIPKKSIAETKQEILKQKKQRQQINEQYQQIKRKNKQSLIKPKINYDKLKFDDNGQQIEDQNYSKRRSRNQKNDKKDGRLNMENKSDASDNQDFSQQARNIRAKNKQRIRSKAKLQIQQNTSNNLNESQIPRNNKQEQEMVFKRGGKGRLNINQVQKEQEEDLQNIQL